VDKVPSVPVTGIAIVGAPEVFTYRAKGVHTLALGTQVLPAGATNRGVVWSVRSGPGRVNRAGLLTFTGKEGTIHIQAQAADGGGAVSPVVAIRVVKGVTAIRTAVTKPYVAAGKKLKLRLALEDATDFGATVNSALTFTSSKPKVARVSRTGVITGGKVSKPTRAVITVKAAGGRSLKVRVTVVPKAEALDSFKVTGTPKRDTMAVGSSARLKVALGNKSATGVSVVFTSSAPKVLKVTKAGRIVAVGKGSAVVTVKAGGKTVKTHKITVKAKKKAAKKGTAAKKDAAGKKGKAKG
jgi:hypothetical protein